MSWWFASPSSRYIFEKITITRTRFSVPFIFSRPSTIWLQGPFVPVFFSPFFRCPRHFKSSSAAGTPKPPVCRAWILRFMGYRPSLKLTDGKSPRKKNVPKRVRCYVSYIYIYIYDFVQFLFNVFSKLNLTWGFKTRVPPSWIERAWPEDMLKA